MNFVNLSNNFGSEEAIECFADFFGTALFERQYFPGKCTEVRMSFAMILSHILSCSLVLQAWLLFHDLLNVALGHFGFTM